MLFFRKKSKKLPKIEFSGVILEGGIGVFENASASKSYRITAPVPAFVTLTPPRDGIIEWVSQLQNIRRETTLAVNLRRDIQRTFALLYDFVDFLIVDTISDDGTAEVPDITVLLDELRAAVYPDAEAVGYVNEFGEELLELGRPCALDGIRAFGDEVVGIL